MAGIDAAPKLLESVGRVEVFEGKDVGLEA